MDQSPSPSSRLGNSGLTHFRDWRIKGGQGEGQKEEIEEERKGLRVILISQMMAK